jgi:hypothetical protein
VVTRPPVMPAGIGPRAWRRQRQRARTQGEQDRQAMTTHRVPPERVNFASRMGIPLLRWLTPIYPLRGRWHLDRRGSIRRKSWAIHLCIASEDNANEVAEQLCLVVWVIGKILAVIIRGRTV